MVERLFSRRMKERRRKKIVWLSEESKSVQSTQKVVQRE
jgi:hypothetical protein